MTERDNTHQFWPPDWRYLSLEWLHKQWTVTVVMPDTPEATDA